MTDSQFHAIAMCNEDFDKKYFSKILKMTQDPKI